MYFLRIAGSIPPHKQAEFEQTIRFVSAQMPASCDSYSFSKDFERQDAYQFMSYWPEFGNLENFAHSGAYYTIKGAFQTLGKLFEDQSGLILDVKDMMDK